MPTIRKVLREKSFIHLRLLGSSYYEWFIKEEEMGSRGVAIPILWNQKLLHIAVLVRLYELILQLK